MFTVRLNKIQFFAYHGVHEEETVIGNTFEVNMEIFFTAENKIQSLEDTINYTSAYETMKAIFAVPEKLLETVAQNIVEAVYETDSRIYKINITIDKINAPISNFVGTVGVIYSKTFP